MSSGERAVLCPGSVMFTRRINPDQKSDDVRPSGRPVTPGRLSHVIVTCSEPGACDPEYIQQL